VDRKLPIFLGRDVVRGPGADGFQRQEASARSAVPTVARRKAASTMASPCFNNFVSTRYSTIRRRPSTTGFAITPLASCASMGSGSSQCGKRGPTGEPNRVHARMVIHREQNARVGGVHGDEEWKAIKQVTSASHGRLVGEIEDRILTPTTYSPALGSMSSGCPNRTNLGPSASPAAISGFPAIADVRPTSCRPIIVAPRLSKLPSSRMAAILKQYLSQAPHEQHGRLLEARVIPRRFSTEQWSRL